MKALIVILLLIPLLASSQSYLTTSLSKKSVSIDLGVKHSTWGFAIGMNAFSRSYSTVKGFGHFLDISLYASLPGIIGSEQKLEPGTDY